MLRRRVGSLRAVARAGAITSIAMIGMLLSANAALAATVIGSAVGNTPCNSGFDTVQISPAYAVPAGGGSISSWTTQSGPVPGIVGLEVWRPTSTAGTYQWVETSPLVTPLALALTTFTLTTPIQVKEGDLLGLRIESKAYCAQVAAGTTDIWGGHMGATPGVGGTAAFLNNAGSLDVEATVDAAVIVPPPPPPSGCDSTNNSTDTSNGGSTDNSATSPTDASSAVTGDASNGAPADTSNVDSTDNSAKDAADKSKQDKSKQDKSKQDKSDQSTGGDNCEQ
jgi:hypothetical protein